MESKIFKKHFYLLVLLVLTLFCNPLQARIVRFYVMKTEPYMDGKVFGNAGSYIKITGQIYGEVDPANPLNSFDPGYSACSKKQGGEC